MIVGYYVPLDDDDHDPVWTNYRPRPVRNAISAELGSLNIISPRGLLAVRDRTGATAADMVAWFNAHRDTAPVIYTDGREHRITVEEAVSAWHR